MIALPLLSRLYVRREDLPTIDPKHRPEFRTKLVMAVELLRWAKPWLGLLRRPIWLIADGAYAKKEVWYEVEMIEDESYYWTVSCEVHINPIRGGIVERP